MEFSADQRRAIESRDGALLVSAAAGSGKTSVLTQRLLERVADPAAPVDVDRFLVITFTRAAAAELRARIMTALGQLAAEHPETPRYRRQQSLCARAEIGTIHSFCARVLREYSQQLGISPVFGILEEAQAERLKDAALSGVLERHYARIDSEPAFRLLTDTVGAGRDDGNLEQAVRELYEKMSSHPYPAQWAEKQKAAFALTGVTDVAETPWGRELLNRAIRQTEYLIGAMEQATAEISAADEKIRKAYGAPFSETAASLRAFRRALDAGWEAARSAVVEFPRLGQLRDYADPDLQNRVKAVRERCKAACAAIADSFDRPSAQLLQELRDCAPAMNALLDLTLEFAADYGREKARQNMLDYSDLEHFTVRLLTDRSTGAKTWVAAELCQRYEEVMVDEYQDVNAVQEAIFRAVSRGEKNLFLVGDVKQSIYRFRLADPGLFLKKYRDYAPAETAPPGVPRKVLLRENYRSRRGVLDAANLVMGSIMSEALGELDYDADAALRYAAADYAPVPEPAAEFHVIDPAAEDAGDADSPGAAAAEARWVARRLLELKQHLSVKDGDGTRPCEWGDVALLLRSPGSTGEVFRLELERCGIPVSGQCGSLFASLEVTVAVNLLAVTDNPHADVPLISVLRSPVFGFTPDDLSAVRAGERGSDFYGAVCAAAAQGNEKCAAFCRRLEEWRAAAPELTPEALIWRLCSDTGLFAVCAAMQDGEARRENLMTLLEYARAFSAGGGRGIYRFLRWLERRQKRSREQKPAAGQAVRIMSIHGSKGLEFPVVFLAGLGHPFNDQDSRAPVVIHSTLGLGPRVVDSVQGQCYPSLARRAIQERIRTEQRSEEMRLLYVAMTRARERLVMSCAWKKAEKKLAELQQSTPEGKPDPELLRRDASPAHWIARAILAHPGTEALRLSVHSGEAAPAPHDAAAPAPAAADPALLAALDRTLRFAYPWAGAADVPVKLTATELKGAATEEEAEAEALLPAPAPALRFPRAEPGKRQRLTPAERGTATHLFLQYADFARAGTEAGLRAELERLTAAGRLTPEEAGVIDLGSLLRLFTSPLGQELRSASGLRREFRFLLSEPAQNYFAGAAPEDSVLLQGVVDCCFVRDGRITVVDYKTDRIPAAEVPVRAAYYEGQLSAYSRALERILGLPVERRVLWFLHPGIALEL